ncbi:MAG: GNAT family N-acetyltransferase [Kineosporiaceae bacterium]
MTTIEATVETPRLLLQPWRPEDAPEALRLYGDAELVRWLSPEMTTVPDVDAMQLVLEQWAHEHARLTPPAGRWAMRARDGGRLVGGIALLPLPPDAEDTEVGYVLLPAERGRGYATEATRALVRWAFTQGLPEVFIVARPRNVTGIAVAERLGFSWVGETSKYYDLRLVVYRLRPGDLDD